MEPMHDMRPPREPQEEVVAAEAEEMEPEETRHSPKQKDSLTLKRKVQLGLLAVALLLIVYGVWWVKSTMSLRTQALEFKEQAESFESLQDSIVKERNRCQAFITQGEGDFGSFEYCKAFVSWANQQLRK